MKYCTKCGKELFDEAVICPNCGCPAGNTYQFKETKKVEDEVSIGLAVLSFFIPLFGIIYWAFKHEESPKKAKVCALAGIASWVLGFVFSMLASILYMGGMLQNLFF